MGHLRLKRQLWQPSHDLDGAHAQFDDVQNQIENISRVIVFTRQVVRGFYDATRFIGAGLIVIDQPAQCTAGTIFRPATEDENSIVLVAPSSSILQV